jgi:hypothetical protein
MKPFTFLAVLLLSVIAVLQLTRLLLGWPILINGVAIPIWASAVAFVVAGGIAAMLWRETRA